MFLAFLIVYDFAMPTFIYVLVIMMYMSFYEFEASMEVLVVLHLWVECKSAVQVTP